MLGERHPEREPARFRAHETPCLVVRKPEEGAVQEVGGEADAAPARLARHCLAENGDVRVVAAEESLVERLLSGPDSGCERTTRRSSEALPHGISLPAAGYW